MKLNKKSIEDLRASLALDLILVPKGCRVHIDKDLLERLIFKQMPEVRYYVNEDSNVRHFLEISYGSPKIIVWSGPFLSSLDLSELSFDNVIWDITNKSYKDNSIVRIDLSNTNANIDFSKSFDMTIPYYTEDKKPVKNFKLGKRLVKLNGVNLSSTDLSNSNLNYVGSFINTDISYSNASLDLELEKNNEELEIINCNFEGIDLSSINLHPYYFIEYNKKEMPSTIKHITIRKTNFKSTEASILPISDLDKQAFQTVHVNTLKSFGKEIASGRLSGCYYNGKSILTPEKRQEIAEQKKIEYEQFEKEKFKKIQEDIKKQAKTFSKK